MTRTEELTGAAGETETAIEAEADESGASTACCPTVTDHAISDAVAVSLAQVYAALADPVRLKLLSLIAASEERCSCDLLEPLGKSQPTISHHTKVLSEAGLITGDKRGRWVYWRVQPTKADFVRQVLEA